MIIPQQFVYNTFVLVLNNKIVIQHGFSSGTEIVNFPITFVSSYISVVLTLNSTSSAVYNGLAIESINKNSFTRASDRYDCYWIAIGN